MLLAQQHGECLCCCLSAQTVTCQMVTAAGLQAVHANLPHTKHTLYFQPLVVKVSMHHSAANYWLTARPKLRSQACGQHTQRTGRTMTRSLQACRQHIQRTGKTMTRSSQACGQHIQRTDKTMTRSSQACGQHTQRTGRTITTMVPLLHAVAA